jgi:hypothetical protein
VVIMAGVARSTAAGVVAAVVGALLWAVIVDVSGYKIGFAAVVIGMLVGQAMALTASPSHRLPLIAAGLALIGSVLGDLFVDLHALAQVTGLGQVELIRRTVSDPSLLTDLFTAGFKPQDIVFWSVAAGAGYRLAARGVERMDSRPVLPVARASARPSGADFRGTARPAMPAPTAPTVHPSQFFNSAPTRPAAMASIPLPPPAIPTQLAVTMLQPGTPSQAPTQAIGPDGRPTVPHQPTTPDQQTMANVATPERPRSRPQRPTSSRSF